MLHAKGKEYKSKVKYSLQIIREAFEGNSCYVSFSGGKDSTAMTLKMLEDGWTVDEIIFADTGKDFPVRCPGIRNRCSPPEH